ncbi:MAG: polyprenol monophosphomannose synthase [Chloroflexi bacterium]|nr:polyprenol monophosphomannose synthase [Chloroflexota bacterium]
MPNLTVVLPTYNEIENLTQISEALLALPVPGLNILVVDDNSPDGTGQKAEELAQQSGGRIAVLHRQEKNGLGPAYIAGFKRAISMGADYMLQMDADFSHQPKYIPELIARLESGYDVVVGSRFAKGGSVDERWGWYRKLLSRFANRVYVPTILGLPINDATGGFRLWRRETLVGIDLDRVRSNGYVFQVEIAYVAHKLGFRMSEVPIYFPDRRHGKSKMSMRIQMEAALRVWQVMARHQSLRPAMRRTALYSE